MKSRVDPSYTKGFYFENLHRHSEDTQFKADNFLKVFLRFIKENNFAVHSFADVGCGSGEIIKMIADSLKARGYDSLSFKAFDVSPHVQSIKHEGIEYLNQDFCESDEFVDVVTLFDVFEHVPDTIEFIKSVAKRCKVIGFHIPLDNSMNVAFRNLFHPKLKNPGHIVFMDISAALNLLAFSGLRVVDYEYTFGFLAPSGHNTVLSKIVFPFRYALAKISPWLLSKTIGGASVVVIAFTPHGLTER